MSDVDTREATNVWSSSLSRSYSEHAALVLRHFDHSRRCHYPKVPKYTRSGPEFRHDLDIREDAGNSEADDEDDEEEEGNQGKRTWRISTAETEHHDHQQQKRSKLDLSTELSQMSLTESPSDVNFESAASRKTTTLSSYELPYRRFDDGDYCNGDGTFLLLNEDSDFMMSDEMKYVDRLEQGDFGREPNQEMVGITESSTSLGTDTGHRRLDGKLITREISYKNWAKDKFRELQRRKLEQQKAEEKRREREQLERQAREEKERREYESYLEWSERKRKEKLLKKKLLEKEMSLKERIREVEDKAKLAKDICLKQWIRRKEEQQKAFEKEQSLKRQKSEEEKQRRLQDSLKAYEKWREKSKNTPRPATQGLLPHQKAKPAFTNPQPWQPLVDNPTDDDNDDDSDVGVQAKASGATIKTQSSRRSLVKR